MLTNTTIYIFLFTILSLNFKIHNAKYSFKKPQYTTIKHLFLERN